MQPIRILLADDHKLFREAMAQLLRQQPGIEVVAEAHNGEAMVRLTRHWLPDIILADINMPVMNGIEATKIIKKEFPSVHIIALSMHEEKTAIDEMLQAGAQGYLLKNSDRADLKNAIDAVQAGEQYLCQEAATKFYYETTQPKPARLSNMLTSKEIEILQLLGRGYSNRQIASMLHRSLRTVDGHREQLRAKTGSQNMAGLLTYAYRNGLIER